MIICYPVRNTDAGYMGIIYSDLFQLLENTVTLRYENEKSVQDKRENKCGKYMWLVTIKSLI